MNNINNVQYILQTIEYVGKLGTHLSQYPAFYGGICETQTQCGCSPPKTIQLTYFIVSLIINTKYFQMSLQLRILPPHTRAKVLSKFKQQHGDNLIPVVLFFHQQKIWTHFKQYMLVAIDPHHTLFQFIKILELKLMWNGYLSQHNRTLFLSINQKQLNPSSQTNMKEIYELYRQADGWLQINLLSVSAFG